MNPKILKINSEIEKVSKKITEMQTKLESLQAQKLELDNTEILELVRSITATPEELATFIKAFKVNRASKNLKSNQEDNTYDSY